MPVAGLLHGLRGDTDGRHELADLVDREGGTEGRVEERALTFRGVGGVGVDQRADLFGGIGT